MRLPILSPKQSRAAALVLLLLSATVVVLLVALPYRMLQRHYDEVIEGLTGNLERYHRIAATRNGLQAQLAQVSAKNPGKYYLKSASPALAAAEIQEVAKTVIESAGGKLTSIQILPHKDDGLYRQVTVNLQFTGTLPAIKKAFYALEVYQPYLFLGNVAVRSPLGNAMRGQTNLDPDLSVQCDLSGYAMSIKGGM